MNVLFVAYQEASNPLMRYSQGLPYICGLMQKGNNFSLMTFETKHSRRESEAMLKDDFPFIHWQCCRYSFGPRMLGTLLDMIKGSVKVFFMIYKKKINVIHARGTVAAIIAFLPARVTGRKLLFDTRGLLADKYSSGSLLKDKGAAYKILKNLELHLIQLVDFSTVETERHFHLLKRWNRQLSRKLTTIPCCIDTAFYRDVAGGFPGTGTRLIYLGKCGTWHMVEEMFDFFKTVLLKDGRSTFYFLTQDKAEAIEKVLARKQINSGRVKIVKPQRHQIPTLLSEGTAGIMFINPDHGYNSSHIKFGEYLACGLPVVVNAGIGDTDVIIRKHKVGVVVKELNHYAYLEAFKNLGELLCEGRDLRRRCVEVAHEYFSLESGVRDYCGVYEKICRK